MRTCEARESECEIINASELDSQTHLMEHQRLGDGAPLRRLCGWREQMQCYDQDQAQNDAGGGINRIDDKHHDQRAKQANEARVPREVFEEWPKIGSTGQLDAQTSEIRSQIGKHKQHRINLSDDIKRANQ